MVAAMFLETLSASNLYIFFGGGGEGNILPAHLEYNLLFYRELRDTSVAGHVVIG